MAKSRFTLKQPEMSKPSSFDYSKTLIIEAAVIRVRNLRHSFLRFLSSIAITLSTVSSICFEYERSSLIRRLTQARLSARQELVR